jgi:hypothetical protein
MMQMIFLAVSVAVEIGSKRLLATRVIDFKIRLPSFPGSRLFSDIFLFFDRFFFLIVDSSK